eukprot:939608-Amphidinium_carterae.1
MFETSPRTNAKLHPSGQLAELVAQAPHLRSCGVFTKVTFVFQARRLCFACRPAGCRSEGRHWLSEGNVGGTIGRAARCRAFG